MQTLDRFFQKIIPEPNSGCWLWIGSLYARTKYSQFYDGTKRISGHRFSYQTFIGEIPDGKEIDHLCRVRCCVNPDHLEAVTASENIKRAFVVNRKTHCVRGHEFTAENTEVKIYGGKTKRFCRACRESYYWRVTKNRRPQCL